MLKNIPFKELKIRNCNKNDYPFIYRLTKRNMEDYVRKFWGGWNATIFKDNFKIQNIRVIEYKKKKIGFYDVEKKDKYLYVHNVQITKSLQRKRVGNYIMLLIEKKASKQGLKKIELSVFNSSPAKKFYLFLGYKVSDNKKHSSLMQKTVK